MTPESQAPPEYTSKTNASFLHRRSRCYGLSAAVSSLATAIAAYEAMTHLESNDPTEVLIGGGLGFAALAGSIAVLGCTQVAVDSYRWARKIDQQEY